MSESQGGAGRREVAFRLFAAEFDDADLSYSESDEERAPNYVVTPTGARVNRLFVVGVLTEVEAVNEDYLRARVVDPTGPFVIYAGQYQPEAMNFLERAEPPLFVAVTGKARTFQPEDSDRVYTSIRPESINEVDAETRDRWVLQAASQTIDRVETAARAHHAGLTGEALTAALLTDSVDEALADGVPTALEHYGTTGEYLAALRELGLDAARVVAGDREEVAGLDRSPSEGSDDPIPGLVDRPIDPDVIEAARADAEDAPEPDVSSAPEPSSTPSPSDEEIDEAVAESDVESAGSEEGVPDGTPGQSPSGGEGDIDAASDEGTGDAATDAPGEETVAATTDEEPTDEAAGAKNDDSTPDDGAGESPATGEEFDGEFELDEEERAEIEDEYGTEFQSGSEVEEPGEAGIETPTEPPAEPGEEDALDEAVDEEDEQFDAEDTAFDTAESDFDEVTENEASAYDGEDAVEPEDEVETASEEALDDAVMDAMADLDDGDGADRDAVIAEVVQSTGADAGEVEEAIQDALMDGRCYEPDDETLKAI